VNSTPAASACNSYVSLADMASYVSQRVPDEVLASQWNDLEAEKKALYVVEASQRLDQMIDWIGLRYSDGQGMKWPRYDAIVDGVELDSSVFPQVLVHATCEMALWLCQNAGASSVTQNAAFDSVRVGPIRVDFNEQAGGPSQRFVPDIVAMKLSDIGTVKSPTVPGTKTIQVARLLRA
jgi:hypothetical protein